LTKYEAESVLTCEEPWAEAKSLVVDFPCQNEVVTHFAAVAYRLIDKRHSVKYLYLSSGKNEREGAKERDVA
jgi:hypothetical protein